MKSTFFHVGVNLTNAKYYHLPKPKLTSCGSLPFTPLPDHHDPDFVYLTYGDPFGRLGKFDEGDVAWFIASATINNDDWGYFLIGYFIAEAIYRKQQNTRLEPVWLSSKQLPMTEDHRVRIGRNAHERRGDLVYDIILGNKLSSKLFFGKPFRISLKQDATNCVKSALNLPVGASTKGYWFKKWFGDKETANLLATLTS